jgi:hypothetical protein
MAQDTFMKKETDEIRIALPNGETLDYIGFPACFADRYDQESGIAEVGGCEKTGRYDQ